MIQAADLVSGQMSKFRFAGIECCEAALDVKAWANPRVRAPVNQAALKSDRPNPSTNPIAEPIVKRAAILSHHALGR